jgi:hypothetical protein
LVLYTCDPSCRGSINKRIMVRPTLGKNAGGMAQVVQHLIEVLSSSPSTAHTQKKGWGWGKGKKKKGKK